MSTVILTLAAQARLFQHGEEVGLMFATRRMLAVSAAACAVVPLLLGIQPVAADDTTAAACTVNHYEVTWVLSRVYENPNGSGYLKTKRFEDDITGPNSNVMNNLVDGWRAVYTVDARDGIGWMDADSLDYRRCE